MKKATIILSACALTAMMTLSACADDPNYYRHRDRLAYNDDGYEVYYDNFYGRSVYDGYWNDDGYYYYRTDRNHPYARDNDRHFRRDRGTDAYVSVRMHDWRNRR